MSAGSQDWRQELSFTDRATVTTKITEAYEQAHPSCSRSDARDHAKVEEGAARKHALTLDEYHELCSKSLQLLLASAETTAPQTDAHADEHRAPNLPEHGATIGRYINANHHRDGLFSEVYKAQDPSDAHKWVALKICTPDMMTAPHDAHREVRVLEQLRELPNIVQLLEVFQQPGGRLVLTFPFIPHDLSTLLVQKQLSTREQSSILRDLFTALAELHSRGIIHRDVKPSNILLASPSGPAYVADFGIVWKHDDPASEPADQKHLEVGTTSYRAPELLFGGQNYDSSLDMWAAGCVAGQVLCLGRKTLFDSGELGSELALIKSIFETLGTPDLQRWPSAAKLPDWGKMNFAQYPARSWQDILPGITAEARDIVSRLVTYESTARATAEEMLATPFLQP